MVGGEARARRWMIAVALMLAFPGSRSSIARADEKPVALWIVERPSVQATARGRRWAARIARTLRARGNEVVLDDAWARSAPLVPPERVAVLAEVEELIERAHRARTTDTPEHALLLLAQAERRASEVIAVPSAAHWYAEVQIALAIAAFEQGELSLARSSLMRALSIDRSRVLRAAEAPPALLAEAQQISEQISRASPARFEVLSEAPGAVITVDDRLLGELPQRVEVSSGTHLLTVEAPGYLPWARVLELQSGERPPMRVALSAGALLSDAMELMRVVERGEFDALPELIGREEMARRLSSLWLIVPSDGALERGLLIQCLADGCRTPVRLDVSRLESRVPSGTSRPVAGAGEFTEAFAWLGESLQDVEQREREAGDVRWWREPWPWVLAGLVIVGVTGAAVAASMSREEVTRVIVSVPVD